MTTKIQDEINALKIGVGDLVFGTQAALVFLTNPDDDGGDRRGTADSSGWPARSPSSFIDAAVNAGRRLEAASRTASERERERKILADGYMAGLRDEGDRWREQLHAARDACCRATAGTWIWSDNDDLGSVETLSDGATLTITGAELRSVLEMARSDERQRLGPGDIRAHTPIGPCVIEPYGHGCVSILLDDDVMFSGPIGDLLDAIKAPEPRLEAVPPTQATTATEFAAIEELENMDDDAFECFRLLSSLLLVCVQYHGRDLTQAAIDTFSRHPLLKATVDTISSATKGIDIDAARSDFYRRFYHPGPTGVVQDPEEGST